MIAMTIEAYSPKNMQLYNS